MKKQIWAVLLAVLMCMSVAFTGCNKDDDKKPLPDVKPITVTLDKSTAKMNVGDVITLVAKVENAKEGYKIDWSSSAPSVATVSGGKVTALAKGETTIIAAVGDKASACIVTVKEVIKPTLSLNARLDKAYNVVTLAKGSSYDIHPIVTGAKVGDIKWTTSEPTVASVDAGVVTALAVGTSTITATLGDIVKSINFTVYTGESDGVHTLDFCTTVADFVKKDTTGKAPCNAWYNEGTTVTRFDVGARPDLGVGAEWLRFGFQKQEEDVAVRFDFAFDGDYSETYAVGTFGGNMMGVMNVLAANGYNFAECIKDSSQGSKYEADNIRLYAPDGTMIEEPNENSIKKGVVYTFEFMLDALKVDDYFSVFMCASDRVYVANVTVLVNHDPSVRIEVEPETIDTMTELEVPLNVVVKNGDVTKIEWTMANPAIASFENNKVKGLTAGSTTLTAKLGEVVKVIPITVASRLVTISLDQTTCKMFTDDEVTLTPTITNALESRTIEWTSSNVEKLTVVDGKMTSKATTAADETITVTATVKEGTAIVATATCVVTIEDKAFLKIANGKGTEYNGATIAVGNTINLMPIIKGGTSAQVVWTSSAPSVATVANGIVTGVAVGEATITGVLKEATVTCAITVYTGKGANEIQYSGAEGIAMTDISETQTQWKKGTYVYSIPMGKQNNTIGEDTLNIGFATKADEVGFRFEFYLEKDFNTGAFSPYGGDNIMGQLNFDAPMWVQCVKKKNGDTPGFYEGTQVKLYKADGTFIAHPSETEFTAGNKYIFELDFSGRAVGSRVKIFMATIQNVQIANVQMLTYTAK